MPAEIFWAKMNDDAANTIVVDDGSGSGNGTLVGGDNTSAKSEVGKINDCLHLNGSDDYIQCDSLVTTLANVTAGAVIGWFYSDGYNSNFQSFWKISRDADATATRIQCFENSFAGTIYIICTVDGTQKWRWTLPDNWLDDKRNTWFQFGIVHNSTTPIFYYNNTDVTTSVGSWVDETDKTVWFKGVFTDATSGADNFNVGADETNGENRYFFDGKVDDFRIYSEALTVDNIATLWNSGNGTEDSLGAVIATAALTGTITSSTLEADIVTGGKTIILTLTDDTWVATVGADNAITSALISGIDSAQSEGTGWDAVVKAGLAYTNVVRTSDTIVTITLPAFATYDITATETITATIPATAVTLAAEIVASPTFTVSTDTYNANDTYMLVSTAKPDVLDTYVDGIKQTTITNGLFTAHVDAKITTGSDTYVLTDELYIDLTGASLGKLYIPILGGKANSTVIPIPYAIGFWNRLALFDEAGSDVCSILFAEKDFSNSAEIVADFANGYFTANRDWCPSDDDTYDLGIPALRWRNIYSSGGSVQGTTRYTANQTLDSEDRNVFCNGTFTVSLPAGVSGTYYRIINAGTGVITIAPNGAENLIGANSSITIDASETIILVYETTEGWY